MKAAIGVLFFVLIIADLGVWRLNSEPAPQRVDLQPELPSTTSRATESAPATQTRTDESAGIKAARQGLDDAHREVFDIGPVQSMIPGFHVIALEPGPKTELWTYVSVGSGFLEHDGIHRGSPEQRA